MLFIGSGCSALIYEIVWFQNLQLAIGSTAISLGVLLSTFMLGMCLGSVGFSRAVSRAHHPLRVYAFLELGIAILAAALLFLLPLVARMYTVLAPTGMGSLLLRSLACMVCLLPPTVLMGATLPAIARWIEKSSLGVARLGLFYGANIAGAVFGCLLAGFYLLRIYNVTIATGAAILINLLVAAIALLLAKFVEHEDGPAPESTANETTTGSSLVYLTIAISGLAALGSEVVWTRLLSVLLGATVYTFAIILAAFLVGLGLGSSLASIANPNQRQARISLGLCQLGLVPAVAWTAYCLTHSLPYWPIDIALSKSPWHMLQLDLLRCFWSFLPAACLWGASFPLAVAAAANNGDDLSRVVGRMYAANTLGAIIGSLLFSVLLVGWLGTQNAQRIVIMLSGTAGLLMLAPSMLRFSSGGSRMGSLGVIGIVGLLVVTVGFSFSVQEIPAGLVGYGRKLPKQHQLPNFVYVGEGMNASVAVSEDASGSKYFHVSGKVVASNGYTDMRLQRMLGHLPALMLEKCESVLIVGCGAGVTAGSFVVHPGIKRIVICEIEPLIPRAAGKYFAEHNFDVMNDPRVEVVFDDARHFIATTREKFDIITSDPIHPWVKGAAALYTVEYFELCQKRLNPGGIATQWVPLYESTLPAVKSQVASFIKVFPTSTVWGNELNGEGYDVVMLGSSEPLRIDVNSFQRKLARADHARVLASLKELEFDSAVNLLRTYAGQGTDLRNWVSDAQLNRDRNLRLQYIAGLGLNQYEANSIYTDMLKHRRFPQNLIVGSGPQFAQIRQLLSK